MNIPTAEDMKNDRRLRAEALDREMPTAIQTAYGIITKEVEKQFRLNRDVWARNGGGTVRIPDIEYREVADPLVDKSTLFRQAWASAIDCVSRELGSKGYVAMRETGRDGTIYLNLSWK